MRAAQIFTPAAIVAGVVSATAIRRADVDCNFATGWYVRSTYWKPTSLFALNA